MILARVTMFALTFSQASLKVIYGSDSSALNSCSAQVMSSTMHNYLNNVPSVFALYIYCYRLIDDTLDFIMQ